MSLNPEPIALLPPLYSDGSDTTTLIQSSTDIAVPPYAPGHQSTSISLGATPLPQTSALKEFSYPLQTKGKTSVELIIITDTLLSKNVPTIVEGSPIRGKVKLSLETPDPIQQILISAKGQIISVGGSTNGLDVPLTFFEVPTILWSQPLGHPRGRSHSTDGNHTVKLHGEYEWEFAVQLPSEVAYLHGRRKELQVFRLPQTFMERHARASICYELVLRVYRGRLRTDYRIGARFGFIPTSRPSPASSFRQRAYLENVPIPGPGVDPGGWHTLDAVNVHGKVFGTRYADVRCTLSIAKPLCYTRGSVIPIHLQLESKDEHAVDLLSNPRSIVLRMRRCIKYHANAEKTIESMAWKDAIDLSQLGVFWPSSEILRGSTDTHHRQVNGELHLRKDLKPTSAMIDFRIEYDVVLFPFDAVAFESSHTEPLASVPVEIATMHPIGPIARMWTPPSYESSDTRVVNNSFFPLVSVSV